MHRVGLLCISCILLPMIAGAAVGQTPADDTGRLLRVFREEFVEVTPGKGRFPATFMMGNASAAEPNAKPAHKVTLRYSFAVARYEVPQNLWQAVLGKNPSRWKGPRNSVEMLSFDEALTFCRVATRLLRDADLILDTQRVRLPSEAEWEYFARAGSETLYSFGNDPRDLDAHGWHTGNAAGNDPPVGAKQPNPWGLYDIHGYLWEWCLDHGHADYRGAPADGSAWTSHGDAAQRVLRGGSWKDAAARLTSHHRRLAAAETKDDAVGLRCVLVDESTKAE